jgi:PKD repeat protein
MCLTIRLVLLLLFIGLRSTISLSQPTASFTAPTAACLNERIEIVNTSTAHTSSIWDFCHQDLASTPSITPVVTVPSTGSYFYHAIRIVYDNGIWVGFASDMNGTKLYRLNFGADPNSTPDIQQVSNLGTSITSPGPLDIVQENGTWYIFILNVFQNKVSRLVMGDGLLQNPTAVTDLGNLGGASTPIGIKIVQSTSNFVFISNLGNNSVSVVDFGTTLSGNPVNSHTLTNAAIDQPCGIDLVNTSTGWKGVISSFQGSGNVIIANFGSDLWSTPSYQALGTMPDGREVKVAREGLEYSIFVRSQNNGIYKARMSPDFSALESLSRISTNLLQETSRSLEIIRHSPNWKVFTIGATTGVIHRLDFESQCDTQISMPFSPEETPSALKFIQAGNYQVELTARDASNRIAVEGKLITVSTNQAPQGEIGYSENRCVGNSNDLFVMTNATIQSYDWNFGDMTLSAASSPSHTYSNSGSYDLSVKVTDDHGCRNTFQSSIKIYDEPVATFALPSGILCTNNDLIFENQTSDNFDGLLEYEWYVNGALSGTDRNLATQFTTTGTKSIKLVTAIPGCESYSMQSTASLMAGPVIDFSYTGICEDAPTYFQRRIQETVTSFSWSFPDGHAVSGNDPDHTFSTPGQYTVSLTAVSPNGCNNSKSRLITIYSRPAPDFSTNPPPLSCTGNQTPFTNLTPAVTDSQIASWRWNFGDPNSSANILETQSASHLYASAGNYTVELKAKTDQGCENVIQKQITIAQSPSADFTATPTCMGLPASLSSTGADIKSYYWETGTAYYVTKSISHTFNSLGEQSVKLTVTGTNNCNATVNRKLTVPIPLVPTLSVWKNCVGYETEFKDNTTGTDPIVWRQWNIGGTITENAELVKFTPSKSEPLATTLIVKGASGCMYSKQSNVSVWKAPVSKFNVTPQSGAVPLLVEVDNLSDDASTFHWAFNDGTVTYSETVEPTYSFTTIGEHSIELKASNSVGCESVSSRIIDAQIPAPDVEIKLITISQNPDKTLKVIVTLQNNGNTIVRDLPVRIDLAGQLLLNEMVEGPLNPQQQHNHIPGYGIPKSLDFLCAETDLENDINAGGNRSCIQLEKAELILSPYPNPATDRLNIEWIAAEARKVSILITDGFGKALLQKELDATAGLNQHYFDVRELNAGLYFLVINDGFTVKTERILISPKN